MTEIALNNDTELATFMADDLRPATGPRRIDLKTWAQEFADVYRVSEALSKTPFVPKEMQGKTADVAAAIMKGRELGMDPFDALGSIYIIHGRVGFYAEFMRRRILQAGHKLRVVEATDSRCVLEGTRRGESEPSRATFTAEQAKRARINLGDYPADKLLARATSRLCRQAFPDVLAGSVIAEDLIDGLIPTGELKAEPQAVEAAPVARKRAVRKPAEAAATQPPTAPKKNAEPDEELAELLEDLDINEFFEVELADEEVRTPKLKPKANAESPPETPQPEAEPQAEPEPPIEAEVIEPAADPITPQQLKKLAILLRECGFEDRETSIAFVRAAIDREIDSSKELTKDEGAKVIDILADSKPID